MIPNIGTLILVAVLLLTVPSLAAPRLAPEATSTSTISYQGRLADSAGNPLTGQYSLEFRIYDVPSGGTPLWTEYWTGGNSVAVSDGLFNVMLGSIDPDLASAIEGHDELYLGITVGTDSEMVPRVQLGSVPFSMQAMTVPDRSVTSAKTAITYWDIVIGGDWETTLSGQWVPVPDINFSFSPPADGVVVLNLSTNLRHTVAGTSAYCGIGINGSDPSARAVNYVSAANSTMNCSTNMAYPVQAGQSYQFSLMVYANQAGTLRVFRGSFTHLTATFFGRP